MNNDANADNLSLIIDEFLEHVRNGEAPPVARWVEKHPELEAEIKELLPLVGRVEDANASHPSRPWKSATPDRIGEHTILSEVGRGAMGVVYRTRHESLQREVALKVLNRIPSYDASAQARFQQEAMAAARLHHKNIVPVFAVGEDQGYSYISMPLIEGIPLSQFSWSNLPEADASGSSGSSRHGAPWIAFAKLLMQAADGLAHAHERGVVHRDIKPSNMILDGEGTIWITDFGLAKLEDFEITGTGDMPGTLRYMPPERFHGNCDGRSDIYALGVTAFELATGQRLIKGKDSPTIMREIADREYVFASSINPDIPKDLEAIIQKCIEKAPIRRYQQSRELGEDLRRFIQGEPVKARNNSVIERLWLWQVKHRWLARALAVGTIAVVFAIIALARLAHEENKRRAVAEAFQRREHELLIENRGLLSASEKQLATNRRYLYAAEMNLAVDMAGYAQGQTQLQALLAGWSAEDALDQEFIGWEYRYLRSLSTNRIETLGKHDSIEDGIGTMARSLTGMRLAIAGPEEIAIWDTSTWGVCSTISAENPRGLVWSGDGSKLAFLSDGSVYVARIEVGVPVEIAEVGNDAVLAWQDAKLVIADGLHLISGDPFGTMTEKQVLPKQIATVDGRGVNLWGRSPEGELLDLRNLQAPSDPVRRRISSVEVSPDGTMIGVAHGISLELIDSDTLETKNRNEVHRSWIAAICWAPDSGSLAALSTHNTIRVWDIRRSVDGERSRLRPREISASFSPDGQVVDMAFVGNGEIAASVRQGHQTQILRMSIGAEQCRLSQPVRQHPSTRQGFSWHPESTALAFCGRESDVRIWNITNRSSTNSNRKASAVAYKGNGKAWACVTPSGELIVFHENGEEESLGGKHSSALVWAGSRLYVARRDGDVSVFDLDRHPTKHLGTIDLPAGRIRDLAYSPAEDLIAVAKGSGNLCLCKKTELFDTVSIGSRMLMSVSFSADGKRILACHEELATIWNLESMGKEATLRGHHAGVFSGDWHPQEERVATGGADQRVNIWDASNGKLLASFDEHQSPVVTVRWSPNGKKLASSGANGYLIVRRSAD